MRRCTCGFKEFTFLFFENVYLRLGIGAKTVFTFLFFLRMPLINTRSMTEKTENHTFFDTFEVFSSLLKCFLGISAHG